MMTGICHPLLIHPVLQPHTDKNTAPTKTGSRSSSSAEPADEGEKHAARLRYGDASGDRRPP
jgi:hypothetical protein